MARAIITVMLPDIDPVKALELRAAIEKLLAGLKDARVQITVS